MDQTQPEDGDDLTSDPRTNVHSEEDCQLDKNTALGSQPEPKVGMTFSSEEEAYEFYNSYAKRLGFSIRKYYVKRRKDGSLKGRTFVCSKEGLKDVHRSHLAMNPRPIERTNCKARIEFKIDTNNVWEVWKVDLNHNHELTSSNKVHMLRSHRKLLPFQKGVIYEMDKVGIKPSQLYSFFQSSANKSELVGFIRKDADNYLSQQKRERLRAHDIQYLLQYLKVKQVEDPPFFYAIQVNDTGKVSNFFWADRQAIMDYVYFGDVVSFDTSFLTDQYEIPFAPMLGMNQHKQIVIFGAALLFDDSTESFVWLFETFMDIMSGKQPQTIFTDQSTAISKAIELVMPQSCHRLCFRCILQNVATNLSQVIQSHPRFLNDFKSCVYDCSTTEIFVQKWDNLITTYNLFDNTWLQNFLNLKKKWSTIYCRTSFCADMATSLRSESMNNQFKKFLKKKLSLSEFIDEYHKAINFFREKELYEDFRSRQAKPVGVARNVPMLMEAAESYSRAIYHEFEEEFSKQLSCLCEVISSTETTCTFRVSALGCDQESIVTFSSQGSTVACSCQKFELEGILCMHCLKVLMHCNILHLPPHYVLKRWTKYAKDGSNSDVHCCGRIGMRSKAFTLIARSANCEEARQHVNKFFDKLTLEVEEILRNVVIHDAEIEQGSNDVTVDDGIADKLPRLIRGSKSKKDKEVLEMKRRRTRARNNVNPTTKISKWCVTPKYAEILHKLA